jgi:MSHA biogenesis protein MshO
MRLRGFSIAELVVTITVLGVLGATAAIYLRPAIDSYFASQRRAELVDIIDTAMRRAVRDVRRALPNSVRVDPTNRYVEFLLTRNGGRYRSANDDDNPAPTAEDILDFTIADGGFDTLGPLVTTGDQQVQAGDFVVIFNLGIPGADAYDTAAANPNIAQVAAYASGGGALAGEDRITFVAPNRFPAESPGRRFFVVSGAVTFACEPGPLDAEGNGTGTLRRWSGYAFGGSATPPTTTPAGATDALLARYITSCDLQYTPLPLQARGLVSMRIGLTRGNENVTLYYEAHVNNVP